MTHHPTRCTACRGTGQMDGTPIIETVNGRPHRYDTVTPCTHEWRNDPTGWDPYYDEPIDGNHPAARAAFATGYAQGRADRAHFHTCPCPHCRPTEQP
jgi:hypothetical protein